MLRALLFLMLFSFPLAEAKEPRKWVNMVGCSLFDPSGQLLKKYLGWVCNYFPNGKMLIGDGFTLTFYDEKMNVVWAKDVHTHHMITYSPESRTATVLASNILKGHTRADRLEVYDIEGRLLKFFNFGPEHSVAKHKQAWDFPVFPYVKEGITMIESFYRIGKNRSKLPYLAEGNYLAYDAAGLIFFFDSNLKIIHQANVHDWGLHSLRDVQVTEAGNLLVYNSGNEQRGKSFTSLDELDPTNGKILWTYRTDPPGDFFGSYEGNVQVLENGNVLYSVVMDELKGKERKVIRQEDREPWMDVQGKHRSFEITRSGKIVWTMANDGSGLSGMPNVVKRIDLTDYFRTKGRY